MRYVVAVSGGVDSVVLLDMLVKQADDELIVAHFDHGIRDDSAADARFVAALAKKYGVPVETAREELGRNASEETARTARYRFLRNVARNHKARLMTAHHRGDVIETIAINLIRGTGWRGLAVLNDQTIERPLIDWTKQQVLDYAQYYCLEWVEDPTNATDAYLRNRIRQASAKLPDAEKQRLIELSSQQRLLARDIDVEATALATTSRYFMSMVEEAVASEILHGILAQKSLSLTRPQRARLILAIKTARPNSCFEAGSGMSVNFTTRDFIVKPPL